MIKLFNKEKKAKLTKKEDSNAVPFLIASALGGILLYLITKQMILFPLAMVLGLTLFLITDDTLRKEKWKKSILEDYQLNVCFLESFLLFSSINNSYWQGFRCAYDALKLSHLKDRITDYLENPNSTLEIKCTNSKTENLLIDSIVRFLHCEEETSRQDLDMFQHYLENYKKELSTTNRKYRTTTLCLLLLVAIFMILAFIFLNHSK
jgi:hypothetical protein